MYPQILQKIREYDKICIFRHERPDGDAMFSALAMGCFISDNYPDKAIRLAGNDRYDLISRNDAVEDSFISKSLAIVLDTSTSERIDDCRALNADYVIKIDHHPIKDDYGHLNLVDAKASACAQILASLFLSKAAKDMLLSEKTCEYLYCGIMADTINFRTTNVTAKTMDIAAKLIRKGNLKVAELVEFVMDKDLESFIKATKIRSYLKTEGSFGYVVLNEKDLMDLKMSGIEAKNNIDEIGRIKDLQIWSIAIENDGSYDVSVRSKRGYVINEICKRYGGGGHENAAAAKQLDRNELNQMYETLEKMTENSFKNNS